MVVVLGPGSRISDVSRLSRTRRSRSDAAESSDGFDETELVDLTGLPPEGAILSARVAASAEYDPMVVSGVVFQFGPFRRGRALTAIHAAWFSAVQFRPGESLGVAVFLSCDSVPLTPTNLFDDGVYTEPVFQRRNFGFGGILDFSVQFYAGAFRIPVGVRFDRFSWVQILCFDSGGGIGEIKRVTICLACERPFRKRRSLTRVM